jgi:hypothetical protein
VLETLQQQLDEIYRLRPQYDVRDFLITDPCIAKALGQGSVLEDSEETLLMLEQGGELSMSLFLDADLLRRLERRNPMARLRAGMLDDLWKVIEGISHFSCMAWKAGRDRKVSLLELELQGEIDKFVGTMLMALRQADLPLSQSLHGLLFDNVRFHTDLNDEQRTRYESANHYASRFCYRIQRQLVENTDDALNTLRHFYRLQLGEKISHIRSRALVSH